jgi:hypothetical protein
MYEDDYTIANTAAENEQAVRYKAAINEMLWYMKPEQIIKAALDHIERYGTEDGLPEEGQPKLRYYIETLMQMEELPPRPFSLLNAPQADPHELAAELSKKALLDEPYDEEYVESYIKDAPKGGT